MTKHADVPSDRVVSDLAASFDPFHDPYLANPYAFLAKARKDEPVFYSPELDYYVVTRYEDVQRCFRDQDSFSATIALEPLSPLFESSLRKVIEIGYVPGPILVNEDPPEHSIRRRRLSSHFTPQRAKDLDPRIRRLVNDYIDVFVKRGSADLVADFVWEIPALVAFIVMGVPEEDVAIVKKFAARRTLFTWGRPTEEEQNRLVDELGEYWNYCKYHVARMKANPGDDFVSEAVRAHNEAPELFDTVYLNNLMLNFLFAGHETTTGASANGLRTLLEHRDQWDELCRNAALVPNAVEEILRYDTSVIAWRRRAKKTVRIGDVEVPEGAKLLIVSGSANRDDAMFPSGETFDIRRHGANRHLSFGSGAHMCMGAPLARMEMQIILEELTRRLPHLLLVPGQNWSYSPNTSFRGPEHILVTWEPGKNPLPEDRP